MSATSLKSATPVDHHALYRALVLEHARSPRNFGLLDDATHRAEGINPLCGDKLELTLGIDADGCIVNAAFEGTGCAISVASASILTEAVTGLRVDEARALFARFQALLDDGPEAAATGLAEPLLALAGVRQFPSRIKCATLAWHAMVGATDDRGSAPVTTE
jgi:nitrogen fixation NifU-like protein